MSLSYKVFLSHSARDQGLVFSLARLLHKFDVQVFVAEWYLTPGQRIDKKVFGAIDNCDCVVVLLTRNGVRSNYVQQEVGYSLSKAGKPLIPVVEMGVSPQDLAALQGREYIEYDSAQPWPALTKLSSYVKSLKLQKEDQEKTLLIAGGILLFLLLLSGGEK